MSYQMSFHTTEAGWPKASGCFPPTIDLYGSLYNLIRSFPQPIQIGWREESMMRTHVLRLCSQFFGLPRDVFSQSKLRIRSPISPPPNKNTGTLRFVAKFIYKKIRIKDKKFIEAVPFFLAHPCRMNKKGFFLSVNCINSSVSFQLSFINNLNNEPANFKKVRRTNRLVGIIC